MSVVKQTKLTAMYYLLGEPGFGTGAQGEKASFSSDSLHFLFKSQSTQLQKDATRDTKQPQQAKQPQNDHKNTI